MVLGLCLPAFTPAARAAASHLKVWAVSDGDKVLRDAAPRTSSAVWSQASGRVVLHTARNEYVAFQAMVTADGADLQGVGVSLGALSGPGGTIPAGGVELFREHYLHVTEPSTAMYGEQSTSGSGWYPDPLVPAGAPDGGLPCEVTAGLNQGVWIDIYVPPDTSPGIYTGTLRVTATGEPEVSLPVDLTVWSFTLPEETHLKSFFMYQPNQLADAHGVGKYSDEYLAIEAEYARMARAHRINLSTSVYPEISGTGAGTTIVWDSWHDQFASRWLDGTIFADGRGSDLYALPIGRDNPDPAEHGGLGSPEFEATFIAMLQQFRDHFQARGWFDRSFLYIVDEPNSREAYDLVRYYGDLIDRSGTGFPFMITEGPAPQEADWGSLAGYVDIWCCGGVAWPGPMQARQALGEQAWTYNGGELPELVKVGVQRAGGGGAAHVLRLLGDRGLRLGRRSAGGEKQALVYISIGEAEDYRWYWQDAWDAGQAGVPDPGAPAWLGAANPDWPGNYKVRYWDPAWQAIVYDYLDKVLASHPDYVQVVSGIGKEDLWYLDDDPQPAAYTDAALADLDVFLRAGRKVLVIDYVTLQATPPTNRFIFHPNLPVYKETKQGLVKMANYDKQGISEDDARDEFSNIAVDTKPLKTAVKRVPRYYLAPRYLVWVTLQGTGSS